MQRRIHTKDEFDWYAVKGPKIGRRVKLTLCISQLTERKLGLVNGATTELLGQWRGL